MPGAGASGPAMLALMPVILKRYVPLPGGDSLRSAFLTPTVAARSL